MQIYIETFKQTKVIFMIQYVEKKVFQTIRTTERERKIADRNIILLFELDVVSLDG